MRKTTKAVSAILAVVMLIGVMMCAPFGVSAAETYGDFEYSLNDDNTCAITRYIGSASDLTIPSEIYGHKVSRIGASITNDFGDGVVGAFENCTSLTRVTIPDGVTSIGDSTFLDCTSLTRITIPSGVTSIGRWAFENCTSLTSITIPESVTWIGEKAFSDCTNLENIDIPDSKIILGPCRDACGIGGECFSRTKWEENQPEGVIYAGKIAYSYKGDMPENTKITLKSGTKGIAEYAFYGRKNLASITIPDSVTSIGKYAFWNCDNLTIYGYENSYAQEYALNNDIPFVAIAGDYTFIKNI